MLKSADWIKLVGKAEFDSMVAVHFFISSLSVKCIFKTEDQIKPSDFSV